jgi:hypothetical protein
MLPPSLESFIVELVAKTTAAVIDTLLERLPEISAAWQRAFTDTIKDAAVDPALDAALRKEQADAIDNGHLPPP